MAKKNVVRARYWTCVLYPDSMVDGWEHNLDMLIQYPYCYCIHDKDFNNEFTEHRKLHIHFLVAFPNTTTDSAVLKLFQRIQPNCVYVEAVMNVRFMYNYLIHDTDDCRKKHKYLYDVSERVLGNNFDIGNYEQISKADKKQAKILLRSMILNDKISNYVDFEIACDSLPEDYYDIIQENSAYFERLCRGNWYKYVYKIK